MFAASDMEQAAAAAKALQTETDGALSRALETAMAVCAMRPFAGGDFDLPRDYVPTEAPEVGQHASLKELRDRTYAHTDKASGRRANIEVELVEGEIVTLSGHEGWLPFPRQLLGPVIEYLEGRRAGFLLDAARIQVNLDDGLDPERTH